MEEHTEGWYSKGKWIWQEKWDWREILMWAAAFFGVPILMFSIVEFLANHPLTN